MAHRHDRILSRWSLVHLGLLMIQFLLGMAANLWVTVPKDAVRSTGSFAMRMILAWAWAGHHAPIPLRLHAIVGVLLGVVSCILVGYAIASRSAKIILLSALGCLSVLAASAAGLVFILIGGDDASMTMSVSFAIALVSSGVLWQFAAGLSKDRSHQSP